MTDLAAHPALAPFRADPARAAVLLDVDGVLAPIVARPEDSRVPEDVLALVAAAADRYALVACVSGRRAETAAALVPVAGLVYAGNHGLEHLEDGVLHTVPDVDPYLGALRDAVRTCTPAVAGVGGWVEDKGPTLTLHYREAPDPERARAVLAAEVVPAVEAAGLVARWGRMVLEVRPPVAVDKGTAVRRLLAGRVVAHSLYAGDDTTDLDAFREVDVAVAVRSAEMPDGLAEAATLTVDGTDGVRGLLRALTAG